MTLTITVRKLTAEAFAPFGDVLDAHGPPDKLINAGRCCRYHDLARLDFDMSGRAGISIFRSGPVTLPLQLDLVERHPLGSQCFIPMSADNYLVVVGRDNKGTPVNLEAFLAQPDQGVNIYRNIWHGVLMPLGKDAIFAVIDWVGDGSNLQEFCFDAPIIIAAASLSDAE